LSKLLLLEDDPALAKSLIKYLSRHGYTLDWVRDGEEALTFSYEHRYSLYLFDINVPRLSGLDLLKALRDGEDRTPTIIISALVDVGSITQGFIAGADDYLKKPFDPEELLIRIKAKTSTLKEQLTYHDYTLDLTTQELFLRGEPLYLSEVQKSLFVALLRHHPNPVPKATLLDLLEKPTDLALRVNIAKLKKHLTLTIKNIRGVGYQII